MDGIVWQRMITLYHGAGSTRRRRFLLYFAQSSPLPGLCLAQISGADVSGAWRMIVKPTLIIAGCFLGMLWFVPSPEAHHAFAAEFDVNKVIELKDAKVIKMEWVNPHAWLTLEAQNADGEMEQWAAEFGPPNTLFRKGYRRSSLLPDMKITVLGFGAADGQNILNVDTVVLPDGRTLRGESNTDADAGRLGQRLVK